ncbi:MAG: hypothetical protein HRF42_01990 [Candidatus Brocadia sp.]|jgi:hypothetical protein
MKEIIAYPEKVTLELIYQVVDERTTELIQKIDEVKKKQEDDLRFLAHVFTFYLLFDAKRTDASDKVALAIRAR